MQSKYFLITVIPLFFILTKVSFSQDQVVFSDKANQEPHPSAILEVISKDKGFLLPRLLTEDREKIDSPAESLIIFNIEKGCVEIYLDGLWNEIWCAEDYEMPFLCTGPITDERDGKEYEVVKIGNQCWLAENLAYLPDITYKNDWGSYTEPQYAVWGYDPGSGNETISGAKAFEYDGLNIYETFGVLYNWVATMWDEDTEALSGSCNGTGAPPNDSCNEPVQGPCPDGWHIPSHYEFTTLARTVCEKSGNTNCSSEFPYSENITGCKALMRRQE